MKIEIKKRNVYILLVIFVVLIVYLMFNLVIFGKEKDFVFKDNKFSYSQERPRAEFILKYNGSVDGVNQYEINFASRNFLEYKTRIYGLYFVPKNNSGILPGVVLLPGGGGTKEVESKLARMISEQGYAVLTIDQRGVGQTGGYYLSIEDDYKIFLEGKEPTQYLSVYDVLVSFDVLSEQKGVDKNNIIVIGESMGGRYGLIATALEKRIKGFIGISSAGFHINPNDKNAYTPFLLSIDPDNYIKDISSRKIYMLHCDNDSVVSLESAQVTFNKANDPKKFYIAKNCNHGYSEEMKEELISDLNEVFN